MSIHYSAPWLLCDLRDRKIFDSETRSALNALRSRRPGSGAIAHIIFDMLPPKRPSESATEMVQVVLPNDANPLGYILGGTVMHLIDIAGAIACHRHTRSLLVTAAVDGLQFLHPDQSRRPDHPEGDRDGGLEHVARGQVEVFSEETLTGVRRMTSRAFLTFVATDRDGHRPPIPGLILETEEEKQRAIEADGRRAERLRARKELEARP